MKQKRNRLKYDAGFRNAIFGIRRGIPFKTDKWGNVKPTGEHPSEVYAKAPA